MKFKIGDRIRITGTGPARVRGLSGTVTGADRAGGAFPYTAVIDAGPGGEMSAWLLGDDEAEPEIKAAPARKMLLPTDSKERKDIPIATGVIDYFPLALAYVARISKTGNDKHNPGQPLHWAKDKSTDHRDCVARHLVDCGTADPENGFLHDGMMAWRALANLETVLGNGSPL
jgi:hypothetical protein